MTVGALTVFLAYLAKFFKPVQDLAKMTNTIAQTAVGLERIQTILDGRRRDPRERPTPSSRRRSRARSTFEHVAFATTRTTPVLQRRELHRSQPGQVVGVVGATGSGKSTVVSLIPRFYDRTQRTRARSTASTCATTSSPRCAARSASCCRRRCSSAARSATTSRTAGRRRHRRGDRRRRPSSPTPTSSSRGCRTATTPWSASAATRCRAGSASASASRARSSATRRS